MARRAIAFTLKDRSRPGAGWAAVLICLWFVAGPMAADRSERQIERDFAGTVRPFLDTYCIACHGGEKQKGKLDLSVYSSRELVARDYRRWEIVLDRIKTGEMPPEEAAHRPPAEARERVIEWILAMRRNEARRHAGDPGPVQARRLSAAEYDHTIRDLTGVDLRPAKEFPVDPANQAGFDNSAESLIMSPALLDKYIDAARRVAEHVVLKPDGLAFAPHPVVTETDRDKYCVKRIIEFYDRQRTDYADYFLGAWRFKHRAALGNRKATLAEIAATDQISPKYLATIWSLLSDPGEQAGPMAALLEQWNALPAPLGRQLDLARAGCERMRDFVVATRQSLTPKVKNLKVRGIAAGSQPLVLWKDRQLAANHRRYQPGVVPVEGGTEPGIDSGKAPATGPAFALPADPASRARYEASLERFCSVFPDAFYVPERVLVFLDEDKDSKGRLLSAGFHLMTGYFRDDAPLVELVLDEPQQRELDVLWDEFHFITLDAIRQYKDFIFFERAEPPRFMQGAEFDFARSEDKECTSQARIQQLAEAYLAKARRNDAAPEPIEAIQEYFRRCSADIRAVEKARAEAEPVQLQALLSFAERASRRPLRQAERDDLLAFYRTLRQDQGLDHEEAFRDTLASILISPTFCFRLEASGAWAEDHHVGVGHTKASNRPTEPLSDHALASRLSYFLWASMPDPELLARAGKGDLHRPNVLLAQTRRMVQNDRIRGLATEFGGNWLDFRRFEEHNSVDRERFKSFNNELRAAMFEEPIRFMMDLARRDGSILEFLDAGHTFVDSTLARHYGIPESTLQPGEWRRVDRAERQGRGGLLPMAVFLTKSSPGLRTSPVKRGYWVARQLLGEQIPPPPLQVPELPGDERNLGELTLREALARHREDRSCAGCHARFDGLGLVFEGYGPIGERRDRDLGGRIVDIHATFPGGSEGAGLDGLRRYLREHRRQEFLDNFCRKLLAYALGRTLSLSDEVLIDDMRAKLHSTGFRFGVAIESIVTSPQFLTRRGSIESSTP